MSHEPGSGAQKAVNDLEWASPQGIIIPVLVVLNLAVTVLLSNLRSDVLLALALGGLYGEAGWLAAWAAIGPGSWWFRTARMVAYSLLLFGECLLVAPDLPLEEKWRLLRIVPVWVLCMQVPVSLVKGALHLQILYDFRPVEPSRNLRQFRIADVLVATGIAAACVASAGVAVLVLAAAAVPIQLLILPSLAAGLVTRNAALSTLWLLCYFAILPAVLNVILDLAFSQREVVKETLDALWTMAGFALTMHGSVMVARAMGFHLRRTPA